MVVSIWWVVLAIGVGGCLGVVILAMMRMSSDEDERMDRILKEHGRPLRGDPMGPPTVTPPVKPRPYVDGDDRMGGVSTVG